jgi:hypothetical protein
MIMCSARGAIGVTQNGAQKSFANPMYEQGLGDRSGVHPVSLDATPDKIHSLDNGTDGSFAAGGYMDVSVGGVVGGDGDNASGGGPLGEGSDFIDVDVSSADESDQDV